jgi:hypothetical protein
MNKFSLIGIAYGTTESGMRDKLDQWHNRELRSGQEIAERILSETGIRVNARTINRWLSSCGLQRPHYDSMVVRVKTGRMDYRRRRIDYAQRMVDYERRNRYPSQDPRLSAAKTRGECYYAFAHGADDAHLPGDATKLQRLLRAKGHDFSLSTIQNWIRCTTRVPPDCLPHVAAYFGLSLPSDSACPSDAPTPEHPRYSSANRLHTPRNTKDPRLMYPDGTRSSPGNQSAWNSWSFRSVSTGEYLYTISATASLLKVGRSDVLDYIARGLMQSTQERGGPHVTGSSIRAFIGARQGAVGEHVSQPHMHSHPSHEIRAQNSDSSSG